MRAPFITFSLGFAGLLTAACATTGTDDGTGANSDEQESGSPTVYVRILDFQGTDQGAWYDTIHKLNAEFDDVCGDTFCEGDFANITPLTFSCNVSSIQGQVKDCAWTFAASQEGVDSTSAAISVDAPTYECHFHPKTTAKKLEALLGGSADAIHETLPGTTGSLYDGLGDCFDHPIGSTPLTNTYTPPPKYVEASDYYATFINQQKWRAAKQALVDGFNNVCGDTFCGSDYSDLWSLDIACSVTKSSGNVKGCVWIFGGSFTDIGAHGEVVENLHTWTCPIAMHGTLPQLITTLTQTLPPGSEDPIHRALPGMTTSAYDAIGNCLP